METACDGLVQAVAYIISTEQQGPITLERSGRGRGGHRGSHLHVGIADAL